MTLDILASRTAAAGVLRSYLATYRMGKRMVHLGKVLPGPAQY